MKKILVLRLDGLGDTLLTLPLIDGLKNRWPDCEITFLASPRGAAVFEADPRISRLWVHELTALSRAEKIALGRYLDGRVTSVVGTHTHVQTSDETLLPKGTAYLTDLGMTGPKDSVIGRQLEPVLKKFLTGMPAKFDVATDDVALEGVLLTVDPATGRASKIRRVRER